MSNRRCFECVSRSLRDIIVCDHKVFGCISVLLGGDFRQTLPVKSKSTREAIISLTLPYCYLRKSFKVYRLTDNMRPMKVAGNPGGQFSTSEFAEWILEVGNGTIGELDKEDPTNTFWIKIPYHLLIPTSNNSLRHLIDFVYGDGVLHNTYVIDLSDRAIICPTNEAADKINEHIVQMTVEPFNTR
ncbi:unnamed protein product [Lactuca saligna]|uniref:ATP-dependent DNA helicase n=1 Tax=Lactuca saligna TaxID=75948 RepID=A0AA36DZD6_LACSI|nr:unnamed protein product [Lactuca saligna]